MNKGIITLFCFMIFSGVFSQTKVNQIDSTDALKNPEIIAKYDGNWKKFIRKNKDKFLTEKVLAERSNKRVMAMLAEPILSFIVDSTGLIYNIRVVNNKIENSFVNEAIRLLQLSGPWIPAKQNGKNAKSFATEKCKLTVWF